MAFLTAANAGTDNEFSLLKICPPPRTLSEALADQMIKTETDDKYFSVLWRLYMRLTELEQRRVIRRLEEDARRHA